MQHLKIFLGTALSSAVPRVVQAIESSAESLHEIAKAFASIAGSLERMASPLIEVEVADQGPHTFSSPFSTGTVPAGEPARVSDAPCECTTVKMSPTERTWADPMGVVHQAPETGLMCAPTPPPPAEDAHLDDVGD